MNKAAVEQSLINIKTLFGSIIQSNNVNINTNVISWDNYKPGIISNVSYLREYQKLLDSQQYSYLLIDNSFFQFYFDYNSKGELVKCRLAYYPKPELAPETADDLAEYSSTASDFLADIMDEVALEMLEHETRLTQNSHLRFDYDSEVKSHSKCHLQFGGINDFRIASRHLVLPFAFFSKIVSDFAPSLLEGKTDKPAFNSGLRHATNKAYEFSENDIFTINC
ncbi:DUF2290 domain-containing protein [Providencia rettgeri]|uniref:DUF2290 domain-containing protein n=1 Tax=Providencia rettgeri TaxID=587 RepID=UPI0025726C90|nr:DUF2290 domain-containing protein [Providencia rettgeri]MDL9984669.1 DUF2290 domain-containing protein [Providencia rettgeri]